MDIKGAFSSDQVFSFLLDNQERFKYLLVKLGAVRDKCIPKPVKNSVLANSIKA